MQRIDPVIKKPVKKAIPNKPKTVNKSRILLKPANTITKLLPKVPSKPPIKNKPNILYLIIYNEKTFYENEMKKALERYIYKFDHITPYFICFKSLDKMEYEILDNTIYFHGKETMLPGILDKTVKALQLLTKYNEYDFIIRSNVSTVINLNKLTVMLQKLLNDKKKNIYASGYMINRRLNSVEKTANNNTLLLQYASGTNIILDKVALNFLLKNQDKLPYKVIDDTAIGILMKKNNGISYITFPNFKTNLSQDYANIVFYRNKTASNRKLDVQKMNKFISYLNKNITT